MKKRRRLLVGLCAAGAAGITGVLLFYFGILQLNNPSGKTYPVRGVDVSSYQGDIDWPVLAQQDIQFAFIKATEGSSFTDPCFAENFPQAQAAGLRVGAYHFFSFDSAGETRAEHFIRTVPRTEDGLPPAVDVEFYGDKADHPPERETVQRELDQMLSRLEEHYGVRPVLYATKAAYDRYLAEDYADYPLWIRSIAGQPALSAGRAWTFWQYTSRMRLPGYTGREPYIDMNVFAGSQEAFDLFGRGQKERELYEDAGSR